MSESRSALARAAPERRALRLRARFQADHRCTSEGSCAFTLSILRRNSATIRRSAAGKSLRAVSARAQRGNKGRYEGNRAISCSKSVSLDLMEEGSEAFAKISSAALPDSAIVAFDKSPSTAFKVSCRADMCAAISLSVMFWECALGSHHNKGRIAGCSVVAGGQENARSFCRRMS